MATFTKVKLSGSTSGRGIKLAATGSVGTTIHTTETSSSIIDEVWIYAYNSDTVSLSMTVEYGGTSVPDDNIKVTIPSASGLTLIVPGLILSGTGASGSVVSAFAQTANKIVVTGYVNRIS
jgi:hypothetical protein